MSDDLYKNMLYFDSHQGGFAKAEVRRDIYVRIDLPILPVIEPLPQHITEMYVYPQVRDYRLRESANKMREMEPPEREAVMRFLAQMSDFGRRLLGLSA